MTPALKAMVEAMAAELRRQDVLFAPDGEPEIARTMITTGDSINLEKVARAGLAVIRELPDDLRTEANEACEDIPMGALVWTHVVDAILKETP